MLYLGGKKAPNAKKVARETWQIFAAAVVFSFVLILAFAFSLSFLFSKIIFEDLREEVKHIASVAASQIDPELHKTLTSPEQEGSETYQKIKKDLQKLAELNPKIDSIYTLRKTDKENVLSFVVDSAEPKDLNHNGIIEPDEDMAHLGELYDISSYPDMILGLSQPAADRSITVDKWGQWISGYAPLKDKNGNFEALVGVDFSASSYYQLLQERRRIIFSLALLALPLSFFFYFWLYFFLRKFNKKIIDQMQALQVLIEKAPIGIYTIRKDGIIDSFNPKMVELAGAKDASEVIGLNAFEMPSYKASGLDKYFRDCFNGESKEIEVFYKSMTGEKESYRRYRCSPLYSPDGKTIEKILLLVEDISQRKKLEEELKKYTEELENEVWKRTQQIDALKEEYRAVLEGSLIGIYVLQDGVVKYANPAALKILGYERLEDVLNRPWQEFVYFEDVPKILASGIEERMKGQGEAKHYNYRLVDKNGKIHEVEVYSAPSFFRGKPALIASMQDVTLERELERKNQELYELRNKFIQVVGHQLRTPLNAIRWNLELLLSEEFGKLKKEQKKFLETTYQAILKTIDRFRDILLIIDLEEGRFYLNKEKVSLESIWDGVRTWLSKECQLKKISFQYEGPKEPLPALEIDREKIRMVFQKLAENAVIYTKSGGKIWVRLFVNQKSSKKEGDLDFIRFEIQDTGIGIPKAEQKNIFKPFYRASNAFVMQPEASGVGLALAKYFVEAHQGKIGFESEENKGSLFWFEIPLKSS